MKAYTDILQSKNLAEILPLESADMVYVASATDDDGETLYTAEYKSEIIIHESDDYINCWSLTALLGVIPKHIKEFNTLRIDISDNNFAIWYDEIGYGVNNELPNITKESPVDACYEMILGLKERNLL